MGCAGTRQPEILKRRRRRHLEALDGFAIFSGVPREPGAENLWHMNALKIFQEPALIHLTGINQANVIVALVPEHCRGVVPGGPSEEVLFVPEKDPSREFWDGVRFGLPAGAAKKSADFDDIRRLTGINDVRPIEEFESWFKALIRGCKSSFGYAFFHQYRDEALGREKITRTDHNFAFKQRLEGLARKTRKGFDIRSCAALHFKLRLPLEPEQIRDVDKAVALTRSAFLDTLAEWKSLRDENTLAAHLEHGMRRRSPYGLSFPSIVAAGRNATVLHYLKNDEPLDPKGLVLMDFGGRWGTMHADITRVAPASGRFNPLQKLLYDIVLGANQVAQKEAKPGATIRAVNTAVWSFLEEALKERFLSRGGKATRAYTGRPHGVSHLMGEQEHDGDPHRLYQDEPLQPGWQISNEPGLYGHFAMTLRGKRYSEWIGIRIEDDLLITKAGSRNLSESIPRETADLERLLS